MWDLKFLQCTGQNNLSFWEYKASAAKISAMENQNFYNWAFLKF